MLSDLDGDNFSAEGLALPKKKRGRPATIPDTWLWGHRDSLVWLFENYWPNVGFELGQATRIDDIRLALSPLSLEDRMKVFVRPCGQYVTAAGLRKTSEQQAEIIRLSRAAYETEQKCADSLIRVAAALQQSEGTNQKQAMEYQHRVRTQALQVAKQNRTALQEKDRLVREKLADEQAAFAQTELLRFILALRYAFTPLNFANAMAGLPQMGWRQSAKRCLRRPCEIANTGLPYLQLGIISACLRSALTSQSLVERVRLFLTRKTKQNDTATAALKKHWYHLRRAIEQVECEKHSPQSLPFRIVAQFRRRLAAPTAVDVILEEEEQLW